MVTSACLSELLRRLVSLRRLILSELFLCSQNDCICLPDSNNYLTAEIVVLSCLITTAYLVRTVFTAAIVNPIAILGGGFTPTKFNFEFHKFG